MMRGPNKQSNIKKLTLLKVFSFPTKFRSFLVPFYAFLFYLSMVTTTAKKDGNLLPSDKIKEIKNLKKLPQIIKCDIYYQLLIV